jgi:MYXO-CTERM domain-containing protein
VPYFVDAFGTRCAMAHLIESTGAAALVARVAAARNNALVPELAGDPELVAWLDQAGLTAAEAARIQPSYCFVTKAEECVCSRAGDADAVAEATVIGTPGEGQALVRVDAVHGEMGLVAVGDQVQISVYEDVAPGSVLVVGVTAGETEPRYHNTFQLNGDTVALSCAEDVPELQKADLIDALLSGDCPASLAGTDPIWGESICEEGEGGCSACAIGSAGAAPSAWPIALLAVAAVLSRRRRRPRGRRWARRPRA